MLIPFSDGAAYSQICEVGHVMSTEYVESGTQIKVELKAKDYAKYQKYVVKVLGSYKTIFDYGEAEDIINKSRFIGYAKPVETEEEAVAFVEEIKKKHKDATHNVPVYLVGEKFEIQRYSDDGEPSGTAGVPVLSMLKNEGITNLALVITRYFGGIKLGTGGLVRAYTHAAKIAVEAARVVEKKVYRELHVVLDYTLHGKFQNFL
ncbi:Impact family like protein, partial [Aduncisulcus paluster]